MIDSHCHLNCLKLNDGQTLQHAIDEALHAGVKSMLCVAIDWEKLDEVLAISQNYPGIFASVGVHPTSIDGHQPNFDDLINKAKQHEKVIAIGETGLDYYREPFDKKAQHQKFSNHLNAAKELGLPVIVHTRSAKEDTLAMIKAEASKEFSGVLHCFTEDYDMAKRAIDLNFYISFSGIVSFNKATNVHEAAKKIPLSRLLIETDSPYLAPTPYRGKNNEPKYLPYVVKALAALRNEPEDLIIEATTENFFNLFKKACIAG